MARRKNVVLIVLDTLRKDYGDRYIWPLLKKYGFKKYDNAVSTAPWTTPSHASMLTGLYPSQHGAHLTKKDTLLTVKLNASRLPFFLPRELKELGYTTYLFSANPLLSKETGYLFDVEDVKVDFLDRINLKIGQLIKTEDAKRFRETMIKHGARSEPYWKKVFFLLREGEVKILLKLGLVEVLKTYVNTLRLISSPLTGWPLDKGVTYLLRRIKHTTYREPSFLLINLIEAHEPYRWVLFADAYRNRFVNGRLNSNVVRKAYEKSVIYLAKHVKTLAELLISELNNPIIIITSDHGQLLGENGAFGHNSYLHDELIRVPLYIYGIQAKTDSWLSLRRIYDISKAAAQGKDVIDVSEKTVFSELFLCHEKKPKGVVSVPCHRIAAYQGPWKVVYDVKEGSVVHKISYDGSMVNERKLVEEIKNFLKKSKLIRIRRVFTRGS